MIVKKGLKLKNGVPKTFMSNSNMSTYLMFVVDIWEYGCFKYHI